MKSLVNLKLFFFITLSSLPTVLSFFGYFEGNKQRLITLFLLFIFFLFQNSSIKNIKETFSRMISNNLFRFLFLTLLISLFNISQQSIPSSINYVDFFAPCCLIIYGIFINQKDLILNIKKIIFSLSLFWFFVGFIELISNFLYGNSFCLPSCIYYNNRPNSLIGIQNLLGINKYFALESIGLNTQQFSLILGLLFLYTFTEIQKKFRPQILIFFVLIIFMEIFSMSYTVFIAQGISLFFLFDFKNNNRLSRIVIFALFLLTLYFVGYFLNFLFFTQANYYISELFTRPILFIFEKDWPEIILGINVTSDTYPAENRILVLFYRFGFLWFICFIYILFKAFKKLHQTNNTYISKFDKSIFIFLLISSIHNHLWHTISGNIILSLIVIYLYEILKEKTIKLN